MLIGALGMADAARTHGLAVEEVARVAFALNERLDFYWFGKQITALKVEDYWQALARESFLDELDWQVRAIVALVAGGAGEGNGIDERVAHWETTQAPAIERWRRMGRRDPRGAHTGLRDVRRGGARAAAAGAARRVVSRRRWSA